MKTKSRIRTNWEVIPITALLLSATIISTLGWSKQSAQAAAASQPQKTFASPDEAGRALQAANQANDEAALEAMFGATAKQFLRSGDPAEDKAAAESFAAKYDRMHRWAAMVDGSQILFIGADNYPFPIPLMRDASSSKWAFDTAAGEDEILARRIGKNELLAIDACKAMANAQELYYRTARDRNETPQYTQAILSSPGKRDGLYWETSESETPSPLGKVEEFARLAEAEGVNGSPVFDGYSFRILTTQGKHANGGAKTYLANGKLTKGFAIIATPVKYQDSGIMTFMLSRDGKVYQKDLGESTTVVASAITTYDPSNGWRSAE